MGKIIVITNLTLDGVMQAPARSDEDPRGGFERGGWAAPFAAMQQAEAGESFANMGALLFGRQTYESFHAFWPNQTDNPFTAFLNNIPKYVASTTLEEPLAWSNSTLIRSDVAKTLEKLKEEQDKNLVIFGSGVLVQSLMRWNLVDEYALLIHPLVLGTGRRLFIDDGTPINLRLRDVRATTNGVVIATYLPTKANSGKAA
ncbi:MAG: dihydrofolate reductase family protein [Acidobacteriota bacterium]|nr:dihydrofolate reductase family protein [Acidobacteriota bacterium]